MRRSEETRKEFKKKEKRVFQYKSKSENGNALLGFDHYTGLKLLKSCIN